MWVESCIENCLERMRISSTHVLSMVELGHMMLYPMHTLCVLSFNPRCPCPLGTLEAAWSTAELGAQQMHIRKNEAFC